MRFRRAANPHIKSAGATTRATRASGATAALTSTLPAQAPALLLLRRRAHRQRRGERARGAAGGEAGEGDAPRLSYSEATASPPLRGADDEASVPGVAAAAAAAKAAEMMKATAGNGNGSATDGGAAAEGKGGATAVAEGKAAYDDEDELRHYFRQVDRATSVNGSSSSSHGNRTDRAVPSARGMARDAGRPLGVQGDRRHPSRLRRVVPGGTTSSRGAERTAPSSPLRGSIRPPS